MKNNLSMNRLLVCAMFGVSLLTMPIIALADSSTSLAESLQKSLQEQGWHESKTDDGSVIYRQAPLIKQRASKADTTILDRKKLGQALKGRGWKADWLEDGSLILQPKANKHASKSTKPSTGKLKPETVLPDMSAFEYWRVVKSDDGSLVFRPVTKQEVVNKTAAKTASNEQCDEPPPDLKSIKLPVDKWEEVYQLADDWLSESGMTGLVVGHSRPVRRFEWFHLVNLVSEKPPYFTHYQLAIRAHDGKVVLLR